MTKIKVVLDTNIYLSGIIFGGNCRHILDLSLEKKIVVFTSPSILLELSQKLERKFKWTKSQILLAIKTIAKSAMVVYPKKKLKVVKADKSDNKILEAAVEAEADYIITGDNHLLKLLRYRKIKIPSPSKFLSLSQKK